VKRTVSEIQLLLYALANGAEYVRNAMTVNSNNR